MARRATQPRTTARIGTQTVSSPQTTYVGGGAMPTGRGSMPASGQGGVYPVDPGFSPSPRSFAQQPAPSGRVLPNLQALAPQIGQIQGAAAPAVATPGAPTGIRAKSPRMALQKPLATSFSKKPGATPEDLWVAKRGAGRMPDAGAMAPAQTIPGNLRMLLNQYAAGRTF